MYSLDSNRNNDVTCFNPALLALKAFLYPFYEGLILNYL